MKAQPKIVIHNHYSKPARDAGMMKPYIGKYQGEWELIGADGKVKATAKSQSQLQDKLKEELKKYDNR
jgi:hypothetical protein